MSTLRILTNQTSLGSIGCTVWYFFLIYKLYSWPTKEHRHSVVFLKKSNCVTKRWTTSCNYNITGLLQYYRTLYTKQLKVRMAVMSDMRSRWVRSYPLGIGKPTCKSQVPSFNEMKTRLTHLRIYPTTKSPALGRLKTLMSTLLPFVSIVPGFFR